VMMSMALVGRRVALGEAGRASQGTERGAGSPAPSPEDSETPGMQSGPHWELQNGRVLCSLELPVLKEAGAA
jgi:hypothetical protein